MGDERQERELLHELLRYAADGTLKTEMVEPAGPMTISYTGRSDGKRYGLQERDGDKARLLGALLFCARRRSSGGQAGVAVARPEEPTAKIRRRAGRPRAKETEAESEPAVVAGSGGRPSGWAVGVGLRVPVGIDDDGVLRRRHRLARAVVDAMLEAEDALLGSSLGGRASTQDERDGNSFALCWRRPVDDGAEVA